MPTAPDQDPNVIVPTDAKSAAFVQDLMKRGEAAPPSADGSLKPGQTHIIVGTTATGLPIVKRVRFNAF